jgi:hypothetical protein
MEEKNLTEQESLQIITDMINKAKNDYRETGVSALLWGIVITFCGLVSFLAYLFKWELSFDIWILTLLAIIPQIWIFIKEDKKRKIKHLDSDALGAVWIVFAVNMFALTFYQNIIGYTTEHILKNNGLEWLEKNIATGAVSTLHPFVVSVSSLYIMLYAMPTLITGLVKKFKPMIIGAMITYVCFVISCFTDSGYDMLLHAIAGTACWLIPGIILYKKYKNATAC